MSSPFETDQERVRRTD